MLKFFDNAGKKSKPVKIGIFGGMGPLTGAEFYKRLEFSLPVSSDDSHPIVYLLSEPTIPRRDVAVLKALNGEVPFEVISRLSDGLKYFKAQKVDFVVCPCNTFHYFREQLEMTTKVKIIDMIAIVANDTMIRYPSITKITLLSTIATDKAGLYDKEFSKHGVEIEHLSYNDRNSVMNIIELVKSGKCNSEEVLNIFCNLIESLKSRGSTHILLACTELSLVPVVSSYKGGLKIIDSMDSLVRGTINEINVSCAKNNRNQSIKFSSKM